MGPRPYSYCLSRLLCYCLRFCVIVSCLRWSRPTPKSLASPLVPASSKYPSLMIIQPSLSLQPPLPKPASPSSASPLFTPLSCADLPRVLRSRAPPASSTSSCRACHSTSAKQLSEPSWLLPPSAPPWTVILTAPPGSLVRPAQLQSFVGQLFLCLHHRLPGLWLCLVSTPLRLRRALGSHLAPPAIITTLVSSSIISSRASPSSWVVTSPSSASSSLLIRIY